MLALPMLKREAGDGQGCHGFVLKDEAVISFIKPPEEDRGFATNKGAIGDGTLAVIVGGKDSNTSIVGRGKKGDAIRPAGKIRGLEDEGIGLWDGGVDKSEGNVIEVPEVNEGHKDIHRVRSDRSFQVFRVKEGQGVSSLIPARSREVVSSIHNGEEVVAAGSIFLSSGARRKRDEVLLRRGWKSNAVHGFGFIFKDNFFRVISSSSSSTPAAGSATGAAAAAATGASGAIRRQEGRR
jgi:hypothetical protein